MNYTSAVAPFEGKSSDNKTASMLSTCQLLARIKAHFAKYKNANAIKVSNGKNKNARTNTKDALTNTSIEASTEHAEYITDINFIAVTKKAKTVKAVAFKTGEELTTVYRYEHPSDCHYNAQEMSATYAANTASSKEKKRCEGFCKKRSSANVVMTIDDYGYQAPNVVWRNNQKRIKVAGHLFL